MNPPPRPRLDAIPTQWSLIQQAHAAGEQGADWQTARQALTLRYAPALRRYLGALVADPHEADELAQDVLVKLLQGDFAGADPAKGRFRDFLKTALRNLVRKRWEKEQRRKPIGFDFDRVGGPDFLPEQDPWLAAWRKQLLDQAFLALERHDQEAGGVGYAALLRLRAEQPSATSEELAARLSAQTKKLLRAEALRQQLRRARVKFAELLKAEVAAGLDAPSEERIADELAALGLSAYLS